MLHVGCHTDWVCIISSGWTFSDLKLTIVIFTFAPLPSISQFACMWFPYGDSVGRIWLQSSSRLFGCRKMFPSLSPLWNVCQMPYSSAHMHPPPPSSTHLQPPFYFRCAWNACVRQIMFMFMFMNQRMWFNLSAGINTGTDFYWQFICLIIQVKT